MAELVVPDLARAIAFRSEALNSAAIDSSASTAAGKPVLIGTAVDYMQVGAAQLVQFTEKLALTDGMDYGPVYRGARQIEMRGTCYDKTHGEAWARVMALADAMMPVSGTFGLYALTFYTIASTGPTATLRTVTVRPNGIVVPVARDSFGGDPTLPLGIAWSTSFTAMDPAVT